MQSTEIRKFVFPFFPIYGYQKVRFFLGYSGWSKGQLESEIEENSWVVSQSIKSDNWMNQNSEEFWKNEMRALGGKYLLWSNAPENPNSN